MLIEEGVRKDAIRLRRWLARERVDRLFAPFVVLQQLSEASAPAEPIHPRLREILTAGEQLRMTPLLSRWLAEMPGRVGTGGPALGSGGGAPTGGSVEPGGGGAGLLAQPARETAIRTAAARERG